MRSCLNFAIVALSLLFGAGHPVLAQPATAPLPAEAFFKHPDVLEAKLSPSGKRLAITTSKGAPRVGLFVFELDGETKKLQTALFRDIDVVSFEWVNDDRLVFSVADLAAGSGEDERAARGLYGVNVDGSLLRTLVLRRPEFVVTPQTAARDALPWNHVLLHVPAPKEGSTNEEIVVGTLVFSGSREVSAVQPQWLNTRNGRTRSLDTDAPKGSVRWWFDSQGQARVTISRADEKLAVHWRGPGQSSWQLLAEGDVVDPPFEPVFVADSGRLYVSHRQGPQGLSVVSPFDFERRAPATKPWIITEGFDFAGQFVSHPDRGELMGVQIETDGYTTVWLDEKMKQFQALADARLPGLSNLVSCRRCGQADMVGLVRASSDRDPGQFWLYTAANGRWQFIASVKGGVDAARMASVQLERIKARDGREIPVWLTTPPGHQPGKPGPAVVLVHDGPWQRGGRWQWTGMEQFLASRGYTVISPEFRGSRGYGRAHLEGGFKQWGLAMQDDIADALLWAQSTGLTDKRACIAGAGYGGYASLMGLVRHAELYRCGVAWQAFTDPLLLLEGSFWVRDSITNTGRRYLLPQMLGDAKTDAEMLNTVSPVAQAERINAPVLLAFGESDRRVPLAHGKRMREALRKAGNEPEWVTYPNEARNWRQLETHIDFANRMEKFLAQHLLAK
jgi:dipeptidyl aminopeptidase/acylaminoacyl peptidase